jgi:hypothetical protein
VAAGPATTTLAAPAKPPENACQLANGVKHVIDITFDNVHFNRDNPNVPSDLEQLPALKNFIESKGTLLSNNHTPLIAHTADDVITTLSGLYGDRQGVGITNSYDVYNGSGGVVNKSAFAYWTANYNQPDGPPVDAPGTTQYPNQPYSSTVPAAGSPAATPPAPWVPFTRAGCNVGGASTANIELENTNPDLQNVFGAGSPEVNQLNADSDGFKDQETNDYVGLAVHCAQNDAFCTTAEAVKFGQTTASPTAAPDVLPDEPGGYTGFQAVFGSKYLTPQLTEAANSGGNRVVNGHTYPVFDVNAGTKSQALTDLNGTEMDGEFAPTAGFPGFGAITAAQSLAYVADMQESGVPVTYAYISDLHEIHPATGCTADGNLKSESALGPGDPCYEQNAAAFNQAFFTFFQRLADDGITPANTEFVFSADEGDHFAGANVGRAITPNCTGIPGVALDTATVGQTPYLCSYPAGQINEVATQVHTLLSLQTNNMTTFYSQPQGEAVYATGNSNNAASIRQLERDFGSITMVDPYDGPNPEPVSKWMVDPAAEQLLHFVNADPNRTPSFTVWPNPDVFFSQGSTDDTKHFPNCPTATLATAATQCNPLSPPSTQFNAGFAWNHGYYAPEVDNTWLGLVGPGVAHKGLDGHDAAFGPNSAGSAASGLTTVPQVSRQGTWADHTDTRSTLLALVGLQDDYVGDGRVLTEVMTTRPGATSGPLFLPLAQCYKQLNSSVGLFGTDVIVADTAALRTGSGANDNQYQTFLSRLQTLGTERDALASKIKQELWNAEFNGQHLPLQAIGDLIGCGGLILQATAAAH